MADEIDQDYEEEVEEQDGDEEEVEEDEAAESDESDEDDAEDDEGDDAESEYTPNLTYSVRGEEREFDEEIRDLIQSEAQESRIRELYEKSGGMDHYKEVKIPKYESELSELRQSQKDREEQDFLLETNPEAYFEKVKFDPYEYVLEKMQLEEMDDDARARAEEARSAKVEAANLRRENERLTADQSQNREKELVDQLNSELAKDDIAPIVGQVEDFVDQVIEYGSMYHKKHSKETTIPDAVQAVAKRYASLVQSKQAEDAEDARPAKPKRRIPSTGAGSGGPTGQALTSFEQLKAKAAQMLDQ